MSHSKMAHPAPIHEHDDNHWNMDQGHLQGAGHSNYLFGFRNDVGDGSMQATN